MLFAFQKFEHDPTSLRIMANDVGLRNHKSQDKFHIDVDIESHFMNKYFELDEEWIILLIFMIFFNEITIIHLNKPISQDKSS